MRIESKMTAKTVSMMRVSNTPNPNDLNKDYFWLHITWKARTRELTETDSQ